MSQMQSESPPPANKKKQRQARQALSNYLKKFRRACDSIETAEEWAEMVSELSDILEDYAPEIPTAHKTGLAQAATLLDPTRAGISKACQVLQLELEKAIKALPSGGCSCGCLTGGLLTALVGLIVLAALLVAAIAFLTRPIDITLINHGCNTLLVRESIPPTFDPVISLLGMALPDRIESGQAGIITTRSLPISVEVDGTAGNRIRVSVLGSSQSFNYSSNLESILVDGQSVMGQTTTVNLQNPPNHTVEITCAQP